MSLTRYLEKHTPIRDAFKELHNAEVRKIRSTAIMVPSQTKNPSFVGTAFDYLARINLASRLSGVRVHDGGWVAERVANFLDKNARKLRPASGGQSC
jgi:hypothetical protein